MPVEGLPIVVASGHGLIGDPGPEIRMGGVRVVVLVILAQKPGLPLVHLAVWGPPLEVGMDPVPLPVFFRLLLVFRIVVTITRRSITPPRVSGLLVAVVLGATRFAVLVETSGVVVLGVLVPLTRTRLPGQDRRSYEHHRRQQPQEQHQPSQHFCSFPKAVPTFPDG